MKGICKCSFAAVFLLLGFTWGLFTAYGFKPPNVPFFNAQTGGAATLPPPFPEAIALYPAPAPPFHIMASSWKHLVRLLAQQETRVEVDLATIAGSKTDRHLRIVVQFLKSPFTTNAWRTIIYLTLDEPVPPNTPSAWRFTNGDTSVLPYSYTKGEELRHITAVNVNSQLYVIPLSATSPFPILPITFPNIALYLQCAMRDSRARRVQNDPSSGMRRLAKIVMACYPDEITQEAEEKKSSRSVGNLLKRVVGRGGAERQESHGNEDVYDIITPFRLDQYVSP
ncbi:hypothetical protein BU17DRAFT_57392 [Hysterangium stoloniferum]|nr:hypothetical protein BU17DRAFT_57392 [Hysterangium stoloniferum]